MSSHTIHLTTLSDHKRTTSDFIDLTSLPDDNDEPVNRRTTRMPGIPQPLRSHNNQAGRWQSRDKSRYDYRRDSIDAKEDKENQTNTFGLVNRAGAPSPHHQNTALPSGSSTLLPIRTESHALLSLQHHRHHQHQYQQQKQQTAESRTQPPSTMIKPTQLHGRHASTMPSLARHHDPSRHAEPLLRSSAVTNIIPGQHERRAYPTPFPPQHDHAQNAHSEPSLIVPIDPHNAHNVVPATHGSTAASGRPAGNQDCCSNFVRINKLVPRGEHVSFQNYLPPAGSAEKPAEPLLDNRTADRPELKYQDRPGKLPLQPVYVPFNQESFEQAISTFLAPVPFYTRADRLLDDYKPAHLAYFLKRDKALLSFIIGLTVSQARQTLWDCPTLALMYYVKNAYPYFYSHHQHVCWLEIANRQKHLQQMQYLSSVTGQELIFAKKRLALAAGSSPGTRSGTLGSLVGRLEDL